MSAGGSAQEDTVIVLELSEPTVVNWLTVCFALTIAASTSKSWWRVICHSTLQEPNGQA